MAGANTTKGWTVVYSYDIANMTIQ